jgi:hypothetical protein
MKVNRNSSVNDLQSSHVQKGDLQKKNPNLGIAKGNDSFENAAGKVSTNENKSKTIQPEDTAIVAANTFGAGAGLIVGGIALAGAVIGQAASSDNIEDEALYNKLPLNPAEAIPKRQTIKKKD